MEPCEAVTQMILILGWVPPAGGPAQGSGFTAAHISGDQGQCAEADGVFEAFGHAEDLGGLHYFRGRQVRAEGLPGEGEEGAVVWFHELLAYGAGFCAKREPPVGAMVELDSKRSRWWLRLTLQLTARSSGLSKPWERFSSRTSTRSGSWSW